MNAYVDDAGRALVTLLIRQSEVSLPREIMAWIDTGFTGELVLPQRLIEELGLPQSGTVMAILADGSQITLTRYTCLIEWFGDSRVLEVIGNDGEYPLLGVGLLLGHDLFISYRHGAIKFD